MQKIIAFFTSIFATLSLMAAMFVPVMGDIVFVHGVKGVNYFYNLYDNREAWEQRKEFLIEQNLDVFQIDLAKAKQAPEGKTAYAPKTLAAEAGVVIERLYVETIPGYYLCANIYVSADPAVNGAPMPLIMLSHGHFNKSWDNRDRFFEDSQYFGAAFARRGFMVVAWDMVGQGDDRIDENNAILEHEDKYNTVIQTWNSMKLLSYVLSERFTTESSYKADTRYVAVTGASGGATQALYTAALDDRVTASIPVVMVSAFFNGDCKCENGVNALRTCKVKSNICERAACFAPKPMLCISDGDDWTRVFPDVGYPYLQYVYGFYGAESRLENFHHADGVHDYGFVKRQKALDFLLRQWELPANGLYDLPYTADAYTLRPCADLMTFSASSGLSRPAGYSTCNKDLYERVVG